MPLPKRDSDFLTERGYQWECVPDPAGSECVVIRGLDVSGGGFTPAATDVMIRIPAQFPLTALDMWYCDPPIRIAQTGQLARASEVTENYVGRNWQRFSRHLNGKWRPGIDSLRSYFVLIQRELQGLGRA